MLLMRNEDKGNGTVRMAGINGPVGIEPLFHRAVIRRDNDGHPGPDGFMNNETGAAVNGFNGPENGLFIFNVSDDVDIGKIGKDEGTGGITNLIDDSL